MLIDKTSLTNLHDDGIAEKPINSIQQEEVRLYLERLSTGEYTEKKQNICPLCSCGISYIVAKKERHGLPLMTVVCKSCGLIRSLNILDERSTVKFYSTQYIDSYSFP